MIAPVKSWQVLQLQLAHHIQACTWTEMCANGSGCKDKLSKLLSQVQSGSSVGLASQSGGSGTSGWPQHAAAECSRMTSQAVAESAELLRVMKSWGSGEMAPRRLLHQTGHGLGYTQSAQDKMCHSPPKYRSGCIWTGGACWVSCSVGLKAPGRQRIACLGAKSRACR